VSNIFIRLKKQYRAANERIGQTGAGMRPEDVTPGSAIANIIGKSSFLWQCHSLCANMIGFRPGDRELQVVAKAARVLAHLAQL
jgi:hypothetical protein